MVIYCTFDASDGSLRADDYYCISQDDNNSSVMSVLCSNIDADSDWEYYLEFRCFDRRGVPTSAYVSPKLTLGENGRILFRIPDCLTVHPGYVAAQLVAYMPATGGENTLVLKSVMRGDRVFDVAPSLSVTETHVLDTPNVFLELENALEELKTLELKRVRFFDCDELVADSVAPSGAKLTAPSFTVPSGMTFVGWYCRETGELWDFDQDAVQGGDLVLYADYYNSDAELLNGTMTFDYLGGAAPSLVHVSFTAATNVKFKLPRASENAPDRIAYADGVDYVNYGVASDYGAPPDSDVFKVAADGLVSADGVLLAPRLTLSGELKLHSGATDIEEPLDEMPVAVLDLGDNVRTIAGGVIDNDFLQILRLGKNTEAIDVAAFYAPNVHHVIVDRMIPPDYEGIGDMFASDVVLYVPDGAVARYQQSEGFGYMFTTIKPMSQAGDMAIDEDELQAAQSDLDDYNSRQ